MPVWHRRHVAQPAGTEDDPSSTQIPLICSDALAYLDNSMTVRYINHLGGIKRRRFITNTSQTCSSPRILSFGWNTQVGFSLKWLPMNFSELQVKGHRSNAPSHSSTWGRLECTQIECCPS